MHELSIAVSLIDVVTEALIRADAPDAAARVVTVEIGDLSGVVPDALATAFRAAARQGGLGACELRIVPVPVEIWCGACGRAQPARATDDLACRACGVPGGRVVRGRELDVVSIELGEPCSPASSTSAPAS